MRFKIGDRVVTKRLGVPTVGTVAGIVKGSFVAPHISIHAPIWDSQYPEWKNGLVYEIEFDKVQKTISLAEYRQFYLGEAHQEINDPRAIELMYANQIPSAYIGVYPEEDLEAFE